MCICTFVRRGHYREDTLQPTDNRYAQNSIEAAYYTYRRRLYCNIIIVVGGLYYDIEPSGDIVVVFCFMTKI